MMLQVESRAGTGLVTLLLSGLLGVHVAARAAPPPVEVFGRLPDTQFAALSPNGKLVAIDETSRQRIVIFDADTGNLRRQIGNGDGNKLRGLEWADDETLLVTASAQHDVPCSTARRCNLEWFRTIAVRVDGSAPIVLLNDSGKRQNVTGAHLLAARTGRPDSVTMQTLDHSDTRVKQNTGTNLRYSEREMTGWASVVFDVNTRTGENRLLATGTQYTTQWVVDMAGMPVARAEWQGERRIYTVSVRQGAGWREIYRTDNGQQLDLAGIDLSGRNLVALGAIDSPRSQAWALPLDGSPRQLLYEDPQGDVDIAFVDENRNAVVALGGQTLDSGLHWLDPKLAVQQRTLHSTFPNRHIEVLDRSTDGERVLVRVDGPSNPPVYQLVDFAHGRADIVGEAYPALARASLGNVRFFSYPARDGTPIPAYLTLPAGQAERKLPTVILPHGGPEARDTGDFDWLAQFLASRGYAVLQPQFRGSTGFGESFRRAGYRQWGGLMQDDVSDGVKYLIDNGIADPARICILGASYGGYAALAGAAFTPDLYACAVSINGVSDLPSVVAARVQLFGKDADSVAYWTEHIGRPGDPAVAAKSPARSAATVRAPVLLLHGLDDSVVPIEQSEAMERALRNAGKPVTFVRLAGEDHWLSRSETRLRLLTEIESFLDRYLH